MTFNPNADISDSRARRSRGKTAGVVAGGVGGLGIIIAIVAALMGQPLDVNAILGGGNDNSNAASSPEETAAACLTGADANADDACRLSGATLSLDQFWEAHMDGYVAPSVSIFTGSEQTPCGTADNRVGPFYCPTDQGIYVEPSFFQIMRDQFGASAGSLAQVYVLGHEWGHHIQNITRIMDAHPNNGTGENSNGVKIELQADCFAGGWIRDITKQKDKNGQPYFIMPTKAEIADALNAASAVGDDNIQSRSGYVNPDSFTHGSSEERMKWFTQGLENGINTCETF